MLHPRQDRFLMFKLCQNSLGVLDCHQMLTMKVRVHSIEEEGADFTPCNIRRASFCPYIPLYALIPYSYCNILSLKCYERICLRSACLSFLDIPLLVFRRVSNLPSYVCRSMSKVVSIKKFFCLLNRIANLYTCAISL